MTFEEFQSEFLKACKDVEEASRSLVKKAELLGEIPSEDVEAAMFYMAIAATKLDKKIEEIRGE